MNVVQNRIIVFVTLLALLALAVSLTAAKGPKGAVTIPVAGQFLGTVTVTPTAEENIVSIESSATGTLTGFGKAAATLSFPRVQIDLPNRKLIVLEEKWTGTITAANGDRIDGFYVVDGNEISVAADGSANFSAQLEISSGTGRFANASGVAIATVTANAITRKFSTDIAGELSPGHP